MKKERLRLQARFCDVPNEELAMFSIVLGVTDPGCVEQIRTIYDKEWRRLRNAVDRARERNPLLDQLDLVAYLEVDLVESDQIPVLGRDKRRQIAEIMGSSFWDGHVWVVTLHGILRYGVGVHKNEIQDLFEKLWRHHKQVHIKPFHDDQSLHDNVGEVVNYCMKHECAFTDMIGEEYPWQISRVAELYMFYNSYNHQLRSLHKFIGPKGMRKTAGKTSKETNTKNTVPMRTSDMGFNDQAIRIDLGHLHPSVLNLSAVGSITSAMNTANAGIVAMAASL